MKFLVATNNEHKLEEMRAIFKDKNIEFLSLKDAGISVEIPETGTTYKENSLQKATFISKLSKLPVLADDSGIEIDALGNGVPGIYSHRYAQQLGGYEKANKYLVEVAGGSRAHFTCYITLVSYKNYGPLSFVGILDGKISNSSTGANGFGYDPIFIPEGYNETIATLSPEIKNAISHRYNALSKLYEFLKDDHWSSFFFIAKKNMMPKATANTPGAIAM